MTSFKLLHGLVALLAFQQAPNSKFAAQVASDPIWSNSFVQTVEAREGWSAIEASEGVYDWSAFDAVVAKAKASGRQCALSVTFGTFTPQWVYAAGAVPQTIHMNDGTTQVMPWPWDVFYRVKINAFVKAFGQRYSGNPTVAYVVMSGFGRQLESYCVEYPDDIAAFDALDGQQQWCTACVQTIQNYVRWFPSTPLIMSIAPPTTDADGIVSLDDLIDFEMTFNAGRFGIRSDGLRPNYDNTGPVAAMLLQFSGGLGITGFQFSEPAETNSMAPYFAAAQPYAPDFIECFEGDVDNPAQAGALAAETKTFQ